jgi:hypothetical protein
MKTAKCSPYPKGAQAAGVFTAWPMALETLVEVMEKGQERNRLVAARELLDPAFGGRCSQSMGLRPRNGSPS